MKMKNLLDRRRSGLILTDKKASIDQRDNEDEVEIFSKRIIEIFRPSIW